MRGRLSPVRRSIPGLSAGPPSNSSWARTHQSQARLPGDLFDRRLQKSRIKRKITASGGAVNRQAPTILGNNVIGGHEMLNWMDRFVQLATLVALLGVFATLLGVSVSAYNNAAAMRRSTEIAAAKWLFDAHMKLNESQALSAIFLQIKWDKYTFVCDGPGALDLNTEKEAQLIHFMDFLNSVDAALKNRLITRKDLDDTTIGFAIKIANRCEPITRYKMYMKRRDAELALDVRAWGALAE